MLLLLQRLVRRRRDQVGQVDGIVGLRDRSRDFRGDGRARLDVFFVQALDRAHVRLELEALPHLVNDRLDVDFDERLELVEADNPRPLRPGHQHLHAGRRLSHAIDLGDRAGRVQVRVGRVVDLRVLLGDQQNLLVVVHREADGGDRRPPAHRQRDDQLGKDDVIAQRHQREPPQLKLRRVRVGGLFDCVGHLS